MAICTTRTLEGMYIFSNPPKAIAAPVSLKQAGKAETFKSYRNSTVANNYRSVYSPNHFISGRPLSGYWWREKKETYEQQVNAVPIKDEKVKDDENEIKSENVKNYGNDLLDAVCQTDNVGDRAPIMTHSSSQTSEGTDGELIHNGSVDSSSLDCRWTSQLLLTQAELMIKDNENLPFEIATRILSRSYMEDVIPNMFQKLKENGYLEAAETSGNEDLSVLPWLMNELELGLSRLEKSYNLMNLPAAK